MSHKPAIARFVERLIVCLVFAALIAALVEARAATFGLCAVALGLACLVMPIITERRRPDDLLPGAMPFEERQRLEQEWERVNLGRRPESAPRLRCVK